MELNSLCLVLQACLSSNQQERSHAEQMLKQNETAPGQIVNLLRVAAEQNVDTGVRQVAAISFKNIVKRNWEPEEGQPEILAVQDKQLVRENIVESLIRAPHVIQSQLSEVIKSIIYADFPERWPGLLEGVYANITSQEEQRVYGGLLTLRLLARKYEFRDAEERAPLLAIVSTTFPVLLQLFRRLLLTPGDPGRIAEYQKLICKVFWSSTFMGIPDVLLQEEQFRGWMEAFHVALTRPIPWEQMPADPDEVPKWVVFKGLKWVLHITHRLFTRYSEPRRYMEPGSDKTFSELFAAHVGQQLLEDHLGVLAPLAQGRPLAPRCVNLALQYLSHAVEEKQYYPTLKPHIEGLLTQVVLPQLCFSAEDAALWEEDPQEFVRKGYDVLEDMFSTKTAAGNFLHTLCHKKTKGHLPGIMNHIMQVLVAYAAAARSGAPVPVDLARKMDGALLAIGTLDDVLKSKAPYKSQLEAMLGQYVVPCFDSPHGHLRAKAAWVAQQYCGITFSDGGTGRGPAFGQLLTLVVCSLQDSELPVRVEGVVALRTFVEELEDLALLRPILAGLLECIFRLMSEVDNEDLVFTLESVVEKFGDEIAPFAVDTATRLTAAFWKYSSSAEDEEEDDDMAVVAAYGCLKALNTLLDGVADLKELFPTLEDILFPIMQKLISTDGQDVLEDVLDMLAYFTFFSPQISPRLWSLWPQIHAVLLEYGIDYWDNFLPPLDNFISRSTDVYLGSREPHYQDSLLQMVSHSLGGDFEDLDVVPAARLLDVVLQNCSGAVDGYVERYLQVVLGRLPRTESVTLKDALMLVVANALIYNPTLTVSLLTKLGAVGQFFSAWSAAIFERRSSSQKPAHFKRMHDKKVALLGLLSVLKVPDASLPLELAAGLPQLLSGIMQLLLDLKQQQEAAEEARKSESGEEEEEEEEEDGQLEDDFDEQQPNEEDAAYMKRLAEEARKLLGQAGEEEESDEEWEEEEEQMGTPLDDVEPFEEFAHMIGQLESMMPARHQALLAGADPRAQAAIGAMVQYAAAQREKRLAKEAQERQQQQQQQLAGAAS